MNPKPLPKTGPRTRQERLAQALKSNMAKRKAAAKPKPTAKK